MFEVNLASKVKQTRRLSRAALLASAFAPCLNGAALAQGLACNGAGAGAFRQSAMATLPQQSAPQQTSPAEWGVNDIPPLQDVPANLDLSAPSDTMIPAGGGTAANNTALQPPGTGGLMIPNTPSTSGGLGGTSIAPTPGAAFEDNFANGIDQSKWGFNYPWSDTCDTNGNADATQYAAYLSPNCSSQPNAGGVFSTGANGLSIAIKPTPGGVDAAGKPYVSGQLYSKQAVNVGQYVEVTAKLPSGPGLGGAFWLLNQNGAWPPELDVFESQGENPNSVTQTMHDGTPSNVSNDQIVANVSGTQSGFHTYGMYRGADTTTFYTDGKATGSYATPASMQGPMYMILSTNASPPGSQNWHATVAPGTPATDFQVKDVRVLNGVPY